MDAMPEHFCMIYAAVGLVLYLLGYEHGHRDHNAKRDGTEAGSQPEDAEP